MGNIYKLPKSVRELPTVEARIEAMRTAVRSRLHSMGICPVSQAMAGVMGDTVGVFKSRGGRYYLDVSFNSQLEGEDERLVAIGHATIEEMP